MAKPLPPECSGQQLAGLVKLANKLVRRNHQSEWFTSLFFVPALVLAVLTIPMWHAVGLGLIKGGLAWAASLLCQLLLTIHSGLVLSYLRLESKFKKAYEAAVQDAPTTPEE